MYETILVFIKVGRTIKIKKEPVEQQIVSPRYSVKVESSSSPDIMQVNSYFLVRHICFTFILGYLLRKKKQACGILFGEIWIKCVNPNSKLP